MSGGSPLQYAKIDATSDGVNVVIAHAGHARQRIVVVGLTFTQDAAGQVTFNAEDDSDFAVFDLAANGGAQMQGTIKEPLFQCAIGEDLEVTTTASQDVSGRVSYFYKYAR